MCDICISGEETFKLSSSEMRVAVEAGFDPFKSRLVNQSTIDQWSRGAYGEIYGAPGPEAVKDFGPAYRTALENWRRELVNTDTSPWRFCPRCAGAIRPFTASRSSGVTKTASEIRGERFAQALAQGSLTPPLRKWWQFWK